MTSSAYPKVLQLGDKWVADIFDGPVEITEKLDGSQIGFGVTNGYLVVRSHKRELVNEAEGVRIEDKLFEPAVRRIIEMVGVLPEGVFFYGETLAKPKHSTLKYDRVPYGNIALFGARNSDESWWDYGELRLFAQRFGCDVVPLLYQGHQDREHVLELLDRESYLGGSPIEGFVVKRYVDWLWMGIPSTVKVCKYVTEKFKETHKEQWNYDNTARGGLEKLKDAFRTEARWTKAIQHLREAGTFDGSVKDIGAVIREVQRDIREEEEDSIKNALWALYSGDFLRRSISGLPEWFKGKLAAGDFDEQSE